jgi:hypothetical protein
MKKLFIFLLAVCLFLFELSNLWSQKIKIETSSVSDQNNKLVINYNLLKAKSGVLYEITLEITGSGGNKIPAKSLTGDIGSNISGGFNKQIIWDYNSDGIVLRDNIFIELFAIPVGGELTESNMGMGKSVLLSALVPGLGIEKGKPYWLIGIAAYGSIGYSVFLNKRAVDSYTKYKQSLDEATNDELLQKSMDQNNLSKTMAYTAAGIWGVNLVWTMLKASKTKGKNITIGKLGLNNVQFYSGYNPKAKTAGFHLKFSF